MLDSLKPMQITQITKACIWLQSNKIFKLCHITLYYVQGRCNLCFRSLSQQNVDRRLEQSRLSMAWCTWVGKAAGRCRIGSCSEQRPWNSTGDPSTEDQSLSVFWQRKASDWPTLFSVLQRRILVTAYAQWLQEPPSAANLASTRLRWHHRRINITLLLKSNKNYYKNNFIAQYLCSWCMLCVTLIYCSSNITCTAARA